VLLDSTAANLNNMREAGDEAAFEGVFKRALFKHYNFLVRATRTTYQEEQRVKHTINKAFAINYADESATLIQDITRYLSL